MLVAVEGVAPEEPELSKPAEARCGSRQPDDGSSYSSERSLQTILEQEGRFSVYEAVRALLSICRTLTSSGHCGDHVCGLTAENVFFSDSDGSIRISNGNAAYPIQSESACIRSLGEILWQMATGHAKLKFSYIPCKLSGLRNIVVRALSSDPEDQYLTLQEFVKDLKREQSVQVSRSLMFLFVLLGATLLLWWVR